MQIKTIEKNRADLKVGDVLVAKQGECRYTITEIAPGPFGPEFPYLVLDCAGKKAEHDTGHDSQSATYTVLVPQPQEA